ncbi:MAG: molybdenum cofactor guanylyltransferase [Maricaulaceae bacterium]|jgi:molybdopterin-guanine dinucleotide biosynthesis protein A
MNLAGLVLAGGAGARMDGAPDLAGAGPKALLDLGGAPLIARPLALLRIACEETAVNAASGDEPAFARLGAPIVTDDRRFAGRGPLAGVHAGLVWAARLSPEPEALITLPCDTPFLPPDLPARLAEVVRAGVPAAVARAGRRHPLCACWRLDLADALAGSFKAVGAGLAAHRFIREIGAVDVDFADEDAFDNVNTTADLERARARLA